jgi:hypothetical protein
MVYIDEATLAQAQSRELQLRRTYAKTWVGGSGSELLIDKSLIRPGLSRTYIVSIYFLSSALLISHNVYTFELKYNEMLNPCCASLYAFFTSTALLRFVDGTLNSL